MTESYGDASRQGGDAGPTEGRLMEEDGAVGGISQEAFQRRSLRRANNRSLSELERACIQMLWRRSPSEPIEITLKKAQFPLTATNLSLVLAHLRSAKDALRIFLRFMRENPSFVPEKVLVDALSRFWKHERERFPVFMSILSELRSSSFQMTPRKLTTLLRGFGWGGLVDEVLQLLSNCEASYGFKPDFVHYSCALHTCVSEKRLDIAMQIFDQMKEHGCPPTLDTFQSLISGLLNDKQGATAAAFFEQMHVNKLVSPSELPSRTVSYINIVRELLRSEDLKDVRSFIFKMNDAGFTFDYFTCANVLNVYSVRGLLKEQRELYLELKKKQMIPDADGLHRFMNKHARQCLSQDAQTLLHSLLNTIRMASKKPPDNADIFEEAAMVAGEDGVSPNDIAQAVVEAETAPEEVPSEPVLQSLPSSSNVQLEKEDILILDRIIYGLSVQEKSKDAFALMLHLVEYEGGTVIPGRSTSAIVFDALCWASSWEEGQKCLRMMLGWGYMPDNKIYNLWVQGSAKAGLLNNICDFMNEFCNEDLTLTLTSFNMLVEKLCMDGRLDEAKKLTKDMKKNESEAMDVVSYSKMIQSFAKAGDFDVPRKLLDEMVQLGITPFALPFTPLIQRLCLSGKVDEAIKLIEEIECKGCKPLPSLYTHVVRAYCQANRLQDAFNIMDIMKSKNITPEPQTHKDLFGSCMGTRVLKPAVQAAN
ncbi:hypothetical protein KP509_39G057600 [Ceratopteris richardii]|nr:hypothetical protein KP509_39G057600 [Ceratopteris richardii]